jgi:HlyD family secretion protein
MKTLLSVLVTALVVGAGGWVVLQKQKQTAAVAGQEARSTTAQIETRNIRFAVSAAGDIGPADQVSVRPEVNGKLEVLNVDVGDVVKKGDLLFKLDDKDLQIEKESRDTAIERARLELEQAQREYLRATQLYNGKLISLELFEDAKTKAELAQNALVSRQKDTDVTVDKLRKTRITAPFDCTVLTRPISVGQAVSGSGGFNSGTEVLTIANLDDLIINAHINQADISRLQLSQEVSVTLEAIPGLTITGKVERIQPQSTIKNNIRGYPVRILLKAVDKKVRPGMTANISIPIASADNVVAAPLAAIFTESNPETRVMERFVYVKKGEEWERRPIEIGVSDYMFVEVTKGLQPGTEVSLEDRSKGAKQGTIAFGPGLPRPPAGASTAASAGTSNPKAPTATAPRSGSPTR